MFKDNIREKTEQYLNDVLAICRDDGVDANETKERLYKEMYDIQKAMVTLTKMNVVDMNDCYGLADWLIEYAIQHGFVGPSVNFWVHSFGGSRYLYKPLVNPFNRR